MKDKRKLFIVNGTQFGYSSGHYFYCQHLLESFEIYYFCFDRGLKKIILDGVHVFYISFKGNKSKRIIKFIKACIKQSYAVKPHILFVTYFDICFLLPLFCKYGKAILDIRTGSLKKNNFSRSTDNYIIRIQSIFFSGIIILSESLRNKLNISKRKSQIVPLGSDIYFSGDHDFEKINLLYVGALNDRNISTTIKGLNLFIEKNRFNLFSINYTIIGFGSDEEILKLMNCISDNNLSDCVKYIGRKTHEELVPYFKMSNIGVVFVPQTQWYDHQPATKLFEYMLSGMPVIATSTYENCLIVNDKNGVLINDSQEGFCEGLMRIYNQRTSISSSEIRKSVEFCTWVNIINNNLKPYLQNLLK